MHLLDLFNFCDCANLFAKTFCFVCGNSGVGPTVSSNCHFRRQTVELRWALDLVPKNENLFVWQREILRSHGGSSSAVPTTLSFLKNRNSLCPSVCSDCSCAKNENSLMPLSVFVFSARRTKIPSFLSVLIRCNLQYLQPSLRCIFFQDPMKFTIHAYARAAGVFVTVSILLSLFSPTLFQNFYSLLDKDRPVSLPRANFSLSNKIVVHLVQRLPGLYMPNACLCWNGNVAEGPERIKLFLDSLPESEHKVNSIDSHPIQSQKFLKIFFIISLQLMGH